MTRHFFLLETHIVLRTILSAGMLAALLACAGVATGAAGAGLGAGAWRWRGDCRDGCLIVCEFAGAAPVVGRWLCIAVFDGGEMLL